MCLIQINAFVNLLIGNFVDSTIVCSKEIYLVKSTKWKMLTHWSGLNILFVRKNSTDLVNLKNNSAIQTYAFLTESDAQLSPFILFDKIFCCTEPENMLAYGRDFVESCNRSFAIPEVIALNHFAYKSVNLFGWKRFYVKKTKRVV